MFVTHGLADVPVSDNRLCFTSAVFKESMNRKGIKRTTSAPFKPASNGLAVLAVQTIKQSLKNLSERLPADQVVPSSAQLPHQTQLTHRDSASRANEKGTKKNKTLSIYPDLHDHVEGQQQPQSVYHDRAKMSRDIEINDSEFVRNYGHGTKWLAGMVASKERIRVFQVKLANGQSHRKHLDQIELQFTNSYIQPEDYTNNS